MTKMYLVLWKDGREIPIPAGCVEERGGQLEFTDGIRTVASYDRADISGYREIETPKGSPETIEWGDEV